MKYAVNIIKVNDNKGEVFFRLPVFLLAQFAEIFPGI